MDSSREITRKKSLESFVEDTTPGLTNHTRTPVLTQTYPPRILKLIAICFVLSGATGLIYEVLWARMLGLVFGATTVAISAVLTAFMGGLALGSALAARFAARIKRPVRAYALIEIAVGLYTLAVPLLFRGIDQAYVQIWQQFHSGSYGFAFSRFVLATLVLLIPTALMGATLPVLVAALQRSSVNISGAIARLYTWNLTGAILGVIAAGFFLLPHFGVRATIWIAATVNLAIGLAAFLLDSRSVGIHIDVVEEVHDRTGVIDRPPPQVVLTWFWLFCAFASGFVTITMQVVWSRVLSMIIGSSTYAFSIVLALFLFGLALGAWLISTNKNADARWLRRAVLVIEILTAFTLFLSLKLTSTTPDFLIGGAFRLGINSWTGLLALQIAAAALLILVPATLMGMMLPLVLMRAGGTTQPNEYATNFSQSSARLVGQSYALNTIGAIAGSVVTAFVLIPGTSTRFAVFCAAALCLIVAGIAYEPRRATSDRALARSLSIGVTMALMLAMFAGWPRLNLNALSTGAYDSYVRVLARSRGTIPEKDQSGGAGNHQLLMYEEGRTATVSVRRDWGITSVAINGRTNGSDADDMATQVILGQLGILTAPRLNSALLVGFATGVTAGSVLQSPIQSIDCVEIEPAAVASSRFFEHVNRQPLGDARLHMIIDDARTYLRVYPTTYDLIISEPSHPWVPGVANLFTREFFMLGRRRLKDDGVFVQWLQIYQLSTESLRSVLATFQGTFPYVAVFRVQGAGNGKDLILVGSGAPIGLNRMTERMSDARTKTDLERVGIKSADDVRSWFVCDETRLGPAVAGAIINTDDNMHVETMAPREAFRPTMEENAAWIESLRKELNR
ncbi:MAG: spermidine synthase [Blastocatellia bacterium]|jgi:spermidine synthase|nr:spermidine synthase [Blastocatellia bacterium]